VFASGPLDVWAVWEAQPHDLKALVGRFVWLRQNELGSRNAFLAAARRQFAAPDGPYAIPPGIRTYASTHVLPRHGQQCLALAAQVLADVETA